MSDLKNVLGVTVLPVVIFAGICATILSRRLREVFFFCLVLFSVCTHKMDVNFVSREWYRGSSRGFEFSLVDVLSISILCSSFLRPRRGFSHFYWAPSLGFILLYIFYACFSVAISDPMLFGFFELSKIFRGLIVFLAAALFVRSERELKILVVALGCAVCWQGLLALVQRYHEGTHRVPGMLGDPNSLSMYLCLTAPAFVAAVTSDFPKYIKYLSTAALLLGGIGLVLTISRAGVAAMLLVMLGATAACVSFRITPKKILISCAVVMIACGIFFKAWHTLEQRYKESTLEEEYHGKGQGRGYYLRIAERIAEDRWFGVGLNNWSYWVSNEYGPKLGWRFVPYIGTENYPSDAVPSGRNLDAAQAAPAHNLGALTVGELGIPGLVIFTILWLRWFQMGMTFLWRRSADPTLRMGAGFFFCAWGIFLQSLTEWVYRETPIFFTFHIILGALASLYYLKKQKKRREIEESNIEDETEFPEPALISP